jgi:hypothetical protein
MGTRGESSRVLLLGALALSAALFVGACSSALKTRTPDGGMGGAAAADGSLGFGGAIGAGGVGGSGGLGGSAEAGAGPCVVGSSQVGNCQL